MLTNEQRRAVMYILGQENSDEVVLELIERYANESVNNCRTIIKSSNKAIDIMIRLQERDTMEWALATEMVINQAYMNKSDVSTYFASMVPVCMCMFPHGNADGGTLAHKEYFNEFLRLLNNPKAFDIVADAGWAKEFGYYDYLLSLKEKTTKGDL